MAKTKISEFSATPANNTDIDGINIAEGCAPSGINDAIRELMSQLKDWQAGTSNDPYVIGSSGSLTLNQGTANGVLYLNGSKVATSGSALTFDGTNLTVNGGAVNLNYSGTNYASSAIVGLDYYFTTANSASIIVNSVNSTHVWRGAGSEQMRLTSTGLGIGTSSPSTLFHIAGGNPIALLQETDQAANSQRWGIQIETSLFKIRAFNDAMSSATDLLIGDRSGNLGLGVTPSAWGAPLSKALEFANGCYVTA